MQRASKQGRLLHFREFNPSTCLQLNLTVLQQSSRKQARASTITMQPTSRIPKALIKSCLYGLRIRTPPLATNCPGLVRCRHFADVSGGGVRRAHVAQEQEPGHSKPRVSPKEGTSAAPSMGDQIRELTIATTERKGEFVVDEKVLSAEEAPLFPRLEMTSLAGQNVIVQDSAQNAKLTLVLLAFRSFADAQLASWRDPFASELTPNPRVQIYDVSVNETISSQALSGFVQRFQRRHVDHGMHDHYLALNQRAGESLESVLPSKNRLVGYALLLDHHARVRFRSAGMASEESAKMLLDAARQLTSEAGESENLRARTEVSQRKGYKGG
jgi:hypothetical protein